MEIVLASSGTHFDPEIVKAFVELKDEFKKIRNETEE
jgi:response regulator RpfG family c-di-GMP phosphodiesterase